jgi:DNA-binding CsgD family transcriptional regulator
MPNVSKSERLRLIDVRQVFRLLGDCRDVGDDPAAWPQVLVGGLTRLLGGQVVIVSEIGLEPPGRPPRFVPMADCGLIAPTSRAIWQEYAGGQEFRQLAVFQRFVCLSSALTTKSREQLVGDAEWYRSDEFNVFHRPMGLDDLLVSFARRGDPPGLLGFATFRALDRQRFGKRERWLAHLLLQEFAPGVGTMFARHNGPPAGLPPRLRQTLDCLLEGDSEKEVALRLGLSRHTVHEYVTALYRRFGVSSRAGLLALCLRRRL